MSFVSLFIVVWIGMGIVAAFAWIAAIAVYRNRHPEYEVEWCATCGREATLQVTWPDCPCGRESVVRYDGSFRCGVHAARDIGDAPALEWERAAHVRAVKETR